MPSPLQCGPCPVLLQARTSRSGSPVSAVLAAWHRLVEAAIQPFRFPFHSGRSRAGQGGTLETDWLREASFRMRQVTLSGQVWG